MNDLKLLLNAYNNYVCSARVFYSCKEDTIAVLTDTRGNKIKLSSTSIVNLRKRLSLQCDTLTTAPPPVTVPQIEGGITCTSYY